MRIVFLSLIYILTVISLISCDQIPEEGTIVYDVDFPRADSCEAQGNCGSGGGGGGGTQAPINPGIPSTPAGVTVTNTTPQITENNTYLGTTIVLDAAPAGTVTITITSGDLTEITIGTSTLTFDSSNWSTPQAIIQTAIEDYEVDGNQTTGVSYTISSTNTSDPVHGKFGNIATQTLDSGRDLFTIGGGTPTVAEGGSDNTTYTFVLDDAPSGSVTVTLTSTDTNEVIIGTPLVFLPGTWNVAQAISLTGVEDYITDGTQTIGITAFFQSTDTNDIHHNKTNSFNVNVTDSGQSSITLDNSNPTVAEGGTTSGTIVLDDPPNGTVTVTLTSSDTTEAQIVPDPTVLTFTPGNYNVPQGYTLNGIEDFIADNDQQININVVASSTDNTDSIDGLSTSFTATVQDSGISSPFTLNPTTPVVAEGATDNNTTIVLTYPPTQNVTVTLTSGDTSEVQFNPSPQTFTFTPANWNQTQSVTIIGVNDFILDNDQSTAITVNLSSTDPNYDNVTDSFNVTTTDNTSIGPTTLASATGGTQQVTLNWSGPSGMSNYTLYYTSDGSTPTTSSDNITGISGSATSYVHAGLTAGLTYTYSIVANLGSDSSLLSPTVSAVPTSFTGCTTSGTLADTDPDLLVHYDFNNNLNDVENTNGDGRYNLVNTGGTIKFAQGCAYGQAAYFDPSTGYAYNNNFIDDNVPALSGNFTVTMWINGDADNTQYSAVYSTGNKRSKNHQLDVDSAGTPQIRLLVYSDVGFSDPAPITNGQWYHVAVTHNTSNQWEVFKNGVSVGTGTSGAAATWEQLKIGINRNTENHWKGYIDEFKVFGRTFDGTDVTDACLLYGECEKLVTPNTPTSLTATDPGNGTDINLTWNAVTGADNYTVYWTDDPSTPIDPSNPATYDGSTTVTGTSATATGLTNGTNYDFTIIATNAAGSSSPATEVNATPTLVLPAAVDNATAYHGFSSLYGTVYGSTYNFNPSYYITWNHHPDRASGDKYYIYISNNASVPIDPNDNTTYIATRESSYNSNNTQILTAHSVYPENDPNFLVGIPPRFGVVFYDASKGVYSPISNQVTPPMASEALREIGDLRINSGYFSADNSTLSSFDRATAIKIVHKDMINVGERFIIDGAFLSSDVIPQLGGNAGYDYLRLNFFNPAQTFTNGRIETNGAYFQYRNNASYFQTNTISSNGFCGTNNSADCHFGMDIIADNNTGMVIKKGTLNNPTDYAVSNLADGSDGPTYFAPNGKEHVTRTRTGSNPWVPLSVNVDNSSYAGLYVYTNDNVQIDINLANADAAISKFVIPLSSPDNLTATAASTSRINLSWNPVNGADNYTIEWGTSSGSYTGGTINTVNTTYSHTGRSVSTAYYYRVKANNSAGSSAYTSEATATTPAVAGFTISSTTATVRESGNRGDMLWTKVLGNFPTATTLQHRLDRNVIDSEMNVISTGQTQKSIIATNAGYYDMMMMKHGPSGELIWQKQFGSNNHEDIVDVAVDSNDNIYVFGYTKVANGGTFDGVTISKSGSSTYAYLWLLIKYNKDGVRQWITQIDKSGSSSVYGHPRAMDIEGSSIYVAGYSGADDVNQVERYDLNGVKQGSTINLTPPTHSSFTSSTNPIPFVYDLDATSNGVFVTVSRRGTNPIIRSKLTKLDNNLTSEVWQVDHPGNYEYYGVKGMPNGNIVAYERETYGDPETRLISIYNSSGSLVTSGAFNQGNTNRVNSAGSSNLAVDSASNILMIQQDYTDRYQGYLVKYNSSGNFVNEKKLPPNFVAGAIDIRQNSAGEEYIYLTGGDSSLSHSHSYGEIGYKYNPTYVGRISNNSVAPVSSTPGYAAITIGVATETTSNVYVCPKYNNAYITTGIISDELAVHPAGPTNQTYPHNSNPFYNNSCLRLSKLSSFTTYASQQLEFYAIQDNVTDANQDITLSFEVITDDTTYQSKTIPNVTVTVENASVSAPNAPLNLKATLDNSTGTSNILTWAKPITNLGEGVQSYTLFWSTDNVSFSQITGITNDNYTHTGLNGSTTYYYRLVANNQGGAGTASNLASATTGAAAGIDWWCCGSQSPSSPAIGSPNPVVDFPDTRAKAVSIPEGVNALFMVKLDNEPIGGTVVYDITASSSRISSNLSQLIFTESADLTTRWDNYAPSNRQWRIAIDNDSIDQSDVNDEVYLTLTINGATTDSRYNALSPIQVWFDPVDDDTSAPAFKYSITNNDNDVSEDGTSDTTSLNLYLDTAPNGNVVVDITVSDPTELAVSKTQLTFTPSNYGDTQNWSVTGVDDALDDGDITSQVTISINGAGTTDTTGYASLSNKNRSIITLDDDAAPVLNSVTASPQTNTLAWTAFPNQAGYRIYWSTSSPVTTSDNLIDNVPTGTTSYQHSGRTAGTTYYYAFMAYTAAGYSSLSNELSATPTAIGGCTSSGAVADNDPDLLVHYAFEGNLEDIEDTNSDNRYDLTNEEGTMQYTQGCAQGQAAYIDSASGFGVNTQFTSTNVGGNLANDNFTISLWVAKDGDMADYASAFNTGFYNEHTPTGDQEKTQIDIQSGKFRAISNSPSNAKKVNSSFTPNMNQWYHVVATHSPPSTVSLYVDGVFQDTNTNMNVDFYGLVVGVNRNRAHANTTLATHSSGPLHWKGYIDEVKVFNRTFSADDVATDCMKSDNCSYVPPTAPTLSADARAQAIFLTWDLPGGTDNATIYWRTSGGVFEGSPTAPTASDNVINVTDNQTSYLLTGLTSGNYYHFVIRANNRNGSSPVSSVLGNVQPTSFVANTFDGNNGGVCKIQNDGSLKCKGRNNLDQFNNDRIDRPSATDIFGITNAETISYAHNKVSVIKSDGTYQHRGNDDGMSTRTSPVTGVTNPTQVGQGNNFVAYLLSDGTVRTRGANYNGQLGDGTGNNETSGTVQVSGITTATKIAVGQYHACALLTNGQVWCWGNNSQGSLGDGTYTNRNSPVQAGLPTDTAVDIFVNGTTSAAVLANGKVYTWGSNLQSKAKCTTNTVKINNPRELTAVTNVKQIDFGTFHSVILTNDGNVYTCGTVSSTSNVSGNAAFAAYMAGIPSTQEFTNGAILMDDYQGRVVEVRATGYNSFMLLDNGSIACIGDNEYGQCNNDGSTMSTDQLTTIIIPDL